jgi:hypothetical protein
VDLEVSQRSGPLVGLLPFAFGALDGEVDELGGGLFVGDVAAGLDALADLAAEVLDAVGSAQRRPLRSSCVWLWSHAVIVRTASSASDRRGSCLSRSLCDVTGNVEAAPAAAVRRVRGGSGIDQRRVLDPEELREDRRGRGEVREHRT